MTANLVGSGPRSSAQIFRVATASAVSTEARVMLVSASPRGGTGGRGAPPKGGLGGRGAPPKGGLGGRGAPPKGGLGGWVPPGAGGGWGGASPPRQHSTSAAS